MRAPAILILLVAFAAAVILPNRIGTPNLPATGSKCLKAGQNHLLKGKAVGWFALPANLNEPVPTTAIRLIVIYRAQSVAKTPNSVPLLI
jgi:hypothetical protein